MTEPEQLCGALHREVRDYQFGVSIGTYQCTEPLGHEEGMHYGPLIKVERVEDTWENEGGNIGRVLDN